LVSTISAAESRSLFGGYMTAAAMFGKNNDPSPETRDDKDSPNKNLVAKPPPPPPRAGATPNRQPAKVKNPPPPPPKREEEPNTTTSTIPSTDAKDPELAVSWSGSVDTEQSLQGLGNGNPQDPPVFQNYEGWIQPAGPWKGEHSHYEPQQQHQHPYYQGQEGYWPSTEDQYADSIAREQELFEHVQNLTETINSMRQLDRLHTRQMDVLTERIMAAEAQIAMEHNRALEYQANCTELEREIIHLHEELSEWQQRCAAFADQNAKYEERVKDLKKNLEEARAAAENLAISIENARIRDQLDGSRRKKKSRGVLGWILGFIVSPAPEDDFDEEQSPRVSRRNSNQMMLIFG
jgi:regulator of replication initiation timing